MHGFLLKLILAALAAPEVRQFIRELFRDLFRDEVAPAVKAAVESGVTVGTELVSNGVDKATDLTPTELDDRFIDPLVSGILDRLRDGTLSILGLGKGR